MNKQNRSSAVCGKPRELAGRFLSAARETGNRRLEASALTDLGVLNLHAGDYQSALAYFDESLALARRLEDEVQENDVLVNLALAHLATGRIEQAQQTLEEQVLRARRAGNIHLEKITLDHLGAVFVKLGEYGQAISVYEQALELAREAGDKQHQADLLWFIAIQNAELGHGAEASKAGEKAIGLYEDIGAPNVADFVDRLREYSQGEGSSLPFENRQTNPGPPARGYYTGATSETAETQPAREAVSGPCLLWMAFTAAKSMTRFFASGMYMVATTIQTERLEVCATCPQHTGVRCKLCGCFTSIKALRPHERCPIEKWPRLHQD
jgi:tetratricopeptide (TPR) repeat protein